jgi:hypothetical protein
MAALALFPVLVQGNTLVVKDVEAGGIVVFGDDFTARLTGLQVPGMDHRLGLKIWDFIKREIHGKTVKVFTWTKDNTAAGIVHDDDGYPFVTIVYGEGIGHEKGGGMELNLLLLQKGYARVDDAWLPEDKQHYREAEKEARENGIGIWEKRD